MIIDLRTIPHGSRRYEFSFKPDWWHSDTQNDQVLALEGSLKVKITIYNAGDKYVLEGSVSGGFQVRCDRCLEPYHRELRTVFKAFLALPLQQADRTEVELMEEDMEVGFIIGEEIDLDVIIREQIYLALPMKSVCRENCPGLCFTCGTNLNTGDCNCHKEQGHPGFLKLRNLKIKGE